MNVWVFPIERLRPELKCEVCGRTIAARDKLGRLERICRACLDSTPEKRAA